VFVSDKVPDIVMGDHGRFRQIVTNLVGNSVKVSEIFKVNLSNVMCIFALLACLSGITLFNFLTIKRMFESLLAR